MARGEAGWPGYLNSKCVEAERARKVWVQKDMGEVKRQRKRIRMGRKMDNVAS